MSKLTATAVTKAKARPKQYKLADSGGMYLLVLPTGSKYWRYDYSFNKKRNTLALGIFPDISLADARKAHQKAREAIISAALIAIKIGINTKDKLIKEVRENTSESSKRVTDVIEKRAGNDYAEGDRWLVKRGDNNSHIFSILPHPLNVK